MICQNKNCKIILTNKGYNLCECIECKLIFSKNSNEESPEKIYENYYKKEQSARFGSIVELIVKFFRLIRACKIYFINTKAKSILDIGSGRGWTLFFLKKYFKFERTAGTQISENAFNFSKEKLKLEIYENDLLDLSLAGNFDIITLWHSLEHVENPEKYIEKIHELLNKNGNLLIEVPNYNAWSRKLTKGHWLALDLKHHLVFFTPSSLTSLLQGYNFKIKKMRTFSLEYSTFTSTQSLVNYLTNSDSYFFEWLQNKEVNFKIFLHAFLFAILFLPCFLINCLLYFSKNGEVIHIVAFKND